MTAWRFLHALGLVLGSGFLWWLAAGWRSRREHQRRQGRKPMASAHPAVRSRARRILARLDFEPLSAEAESLTDDTYLGEM